MTISIKQNDNKAFYKSLISLVMPLTLNNLINVGVSAADTLFLGNVSENAITAVSLSNQIQFIMLLILFGTNSGASILAAQYYGKFDIKSMEKVLAIAIDITIIVAGIFTLLALLYPHVLLSIYTHDEEIIRLGSTYLRMVGSTYIISSITLMYLGIIRNADKVIISTIVYSISLIINICINAIFIFGLFNAPKLGVIGVAIGTMVARITELLIVIYYNSKEDTLLKLKPKLLFSLDRNLLKDFFIYASPVIINEMLWGVGTSSYSAIIAQLSTKAAAANAVAQLIRQLSQVVSIGLANAASIMIGQMIGENSLDRAKLYASKFLKLTLLFGFIGAGLIQIFKMFPIKYMQLSSETKEIFIYMTNFISIYSIIQIINVLLVVGILRAGGDTKFSMIADVLFMWLISIPLGYICGFYFNVNAKYVFIILSIDEFLKFPILYLRYKKDIWLKNITR